MQRFWKSFYVVSFCGCLVGGYRNVLPEQAKGTNADWILTSVAFLAASIMPLAFMAYSRRRGTTVYRRPTFDRWPLGWWSDTLQPLRVSLIASVLTGIGAAVALPQVDHKGVMLFFTYAAFAAGLGLGERFVYWVYADRISGESSPSPA